jgi:hypothetical protein
MAELAAGVRQAERLLAQLRTALGDDRLRRVVQQAEVAGWMR